MKQYNILDYGARADGNLHTAPIQAAIDDCFRNGGGEVVVPAGTYRTGTIRLRSHMTLRLLPGAVLEASRDRQDYDHFFDDATDPVPREPDKAFPSLKKDPWGLALILCYGAQDVRIVGEAGALIDGKNSYFPNGEEGYRGAHAIMIAHCKNVELSGYTVRDSGNWAHICAFSENLYVHDIKVLAGHDGFHMRMSRNLLIEHCEFYTGDDCVAGFGVDGAVVRDCVLNSACSLFRLGGRNILIDHCHGFGPGVFGHRWKMADEDKIAGAPTNETHRNNTLTVFLYFCCAGAPLPTPENVVIQNCTFDGVDQFLNDSFGKGGEVWCCNRNLHDITVRNCRVTNLAIPSLVLASDEEPTDIRIEDSEISMRRGRETTQFLNTSACREIFLRNVRFGGFADTPTIRVAAHGDTSVTTPDCENIRVVRGE